MLPLQIPSLSENPVLARIYGETLADMPSDLYIPPEALSVMLDAFEGPLDLLLYLIRKANIDILDIPMASLTAQYIDYIEKMQEENLELVADYLLMAAMLIEIKSRMLLPRPKKTADETEADPRAELVQRLIEYEQMKKAGSFFQGLPQAGRDFFWVETLIEKSLSQPLPVVSIDDLKSAWQAILSRAKLNQHHLINREKLSVREHMGKILRYLRSVKGFVPFESLFDEEKGIASLVVHFLALLELAREQLLEISQHAPFSPIYLRLRQGDQGLENDRLRHEILASDISEH